MLWLKSLHIVAVIAWMAGLLYLFRLFVYHAQETVPVVMERFALMERRLLFAITTPAMIVAVLTGVALAVPFWPQAWLLGKIALVAGMLAVHGFAVHVRTDPKAYSHQLMRVMNEVPTLLMIGIVLLVEFKPLITGR